MVKAVVKCIRKKSRFNLDLFGKNAVARSGKECVVMRESLLLKAMEGYSLLLKAGRESLLLKRSESLLLNYFDANVISGMQCSSVGLGWQLVTPKLAASRE